MSTTSTKQEENVCSTPEYRLDGLQALIVYHHSEMQVIADSIQHLRNKEVSTKKEFDERAKELEKLMSQLNGERRILNVYEVKAKVAAQKIYTDEP